MLNLLAIPLVFALFFGVLMFINWYSGETVVNNYRSGSFELNLGDTLVVEGIRNYDGRVVSIEIIGNEVVSATKVGGTITKEYKFVSEAEWVRAAANVAAAYADQYPTVLVAVTGWDHVAGYRKVIRVNGKWMT